jgi:16S rRNA (guanine527-N7)-methyltransferase
MHQGIESTIDEARLRSLVTVFLEENRKLNLSAFRSEEHCWIGNVLDSIALLQADLEKPLLKDVQRIVDIGTGGGFPLLPLAMCLPSVACFGIDATQKKVDAVRRIVTTLDLKNVTLLPGRLEELAHTDALRSSFDLVTVRAVAPLPALLEYAVGFLKVGGLLACWKSSKVAQELASTAKAQQVLAMQFLRIFTYELPGAFGERTILFFRKTRPTPEAYPRKVGVPKAKPLS